MFCSPVWRGRLKIPVCWRAIHYADFLSSGKPFQILLQFYPETVIANPSVGRIGKARRRRQQAAHRQVIAIPTNQQNSSGENQASESCSQTSTSTHASNAKSQGEGAESSLSSPILSSGRNLATTNHMMTTTAAAFEEYTRSALQRLNLPMISKHDFTTVWESVAPYMVFRQPSPHFFFSVLFAFLF